MSASLSRPRIINSSNFKAPKPSLEKSSTEEPPSPFTHVLFQFELGQRLSKVPGIAADTLAPSQISVFKAEIERWLSELPSTYNLSAPDTKWDAKCQYIVPQRIQLNALGYMILFQQLKSFLVKPEAKNAEEINLRKVGIECALKLVDIARQDVEIEFPIHTKFCFAIFVIFDTAATLCSAVIHDPSGKLPRRTKVIEGIGSLLRLLEMIKDHAKTAAVCHGILSRLVANMPVVLPEYYSGLPGVTMSPSDIFKTQEDSPLENLSATDTSGLNDAVNDNLFDAGISGLPDAALDFSLAEAASTQDWLPGVGNFSIMDLGAIDQELYWDSLDLNLPFEPLPKN